MKKTFFAGILVLLPIFITLWLISWIIGLLDQSLLLIPKAWRPDSLLGFDIPGLGAILSIVLIFIIGFLAKNLLGRKLLNFGEWILFKIPVVRSVYKSVKQISDTLLSSDGNAFREPVLVQYPLEGSWTVGFITGSPEGDVATVLSGEHIGVFVPTTPNPTSGFFLIVPKNDVKPLNMGVDQALRYIVSFGVVGPDKKDSLPAPEKS